MRGLLCAKVRVRFLGALSIQPKIPEISVGKSNEADQFGLVRPEYSRPAVKVVHFDRSGNFGPFPFDKIVVPSATLLYPAYKNNNETRSGLDWVCATGNVPFHWARAISEISNRNIC